MTQIEPQRNSFLADLISINETGDILAITGCLELEFTNKTSAWIFGETYSIYKGNGQWWGTQLLHQPKVQGSIPVSTTVAIIMYQIIWI